MMPRAFTVLAAVSLVLCLGLFVCPKFGDAHRFWLSTPFGDMGPFDDSSESILKGTMVALAAPPVLWAVIAIGRARERARRRTLSGSGRCTSCGYDLRASTGRCPECAEPIVGAKG